jgi:hypothetical protein
LIPARLYGGSSSATGEPAELAIVADNIEVRTITAVDVVQFQRLRIREVGFEKPGLEFAWDTPEGVRAVQVLDVNAVGSLRASSALASLPQFTALRTAQRRHAFGRPLGWTLLGMFVFFPVLAIVLFVWQADRIAHAAAERISIADEVKLGDGAFAQMSASLDLKDSGPVFDTLQTLSKRLTHGSKYTYRAHVAQSDVVNAFALPGGIIVVNTGLINATRRPEELAGVLAHEMQHVERRHSLVAVIKDMGLRGLWMLVTGDVGSGVLSGAAIELTSLRFSRDAEAEADARGFDTLVAAGIDPSGMPDFFQVLAKDSGAAPPPFLSTHPASTDREQHLRARVTELKQRHFEPLDFGKWPPT